METELAKKLEKAMKDHYAIYGEKKLQEPAHEDVMKKHFELYGCKYSRECLP